MDRRFICSQCGTKWFIGSADRDRPDLSRCDACGGELRSLKAVPGGTFAAPAEPDDG